METILDTEAEKYQAQSVSSEGCRDGGSMTNSLAASYRWIQHQEAWSDLDAFLSQLVAESNRDLDIMPVEHLSSTVAAHGRGMRDAVQKIRAHIDYALSGGPK